MLPLCASPFKQRIDFNQRLILVYSSVIVHNIKDINVPSTMRVYLSRHVAFDESNFFLLILLMFPAFKHRLRKWQLLLTTTKMTFLDGKKSARSS